MSPAPIAEMERKAGTLWDAVNRRVHITTDIREPGLLSVYRIRLINIFIDNILLIDSNACHYLVCFSFRLRGARLLDFPGLGY